MEYVWSAYVMPDIAITDLNIAVDKGDGVLMALGTGASYTLPSGWNLVEFCRFVAVGHHVRLEFSVNPPDVNGSSSWFVDDMELVPVTEALDMITKRIRDAILLDLADITVANGFSTTLVEVGAEPKRIADSTLPCVFLTTGPGGRGEAYQLSNFAGHTTHQFVVQMMVRSSTPNADMDNLLDDVKNSVERSTSHVTALTEVDDITVVDWTETTVSGDISNSTYYREATIQVSYVYSRGAA
jgi:hypothetical protein